MRLVVTGASGNVGTALLERLRSVTGVTAVVAVAQRRTNAAVAGAGTPSARLRPAGVRR